MEGGFKNLIIGFIIIGLFAILLVRVVNDEATLYGKDTAEVTGGALDLNAFEENITSIAEDAETKRQKFENQNIFYTLGEIVIGGLFDILKSFISMVIIPFTLITSILSNTLHVPKIVSQVFIGILSISIIFHIWRTIKIGD